MSPVLISSLVFLISFHVVMADEALITHTCSITPYPSVCTKALKSDPKSASARTGDLGGILVSQYLSKTKQALEIVNSARKSTRDQKVLRALTQCAEKYNIVISATGPAAYEAFVKGNPKFAVDYSHDAKYEAETCERVLSSTGRSPVSQLNRDIVELASVAEAIGKSML